MPTCSQAKILTNLEGDMNKRIFKLSSGSDQPITTYHNSSNGNNTLTYQQLYQQSQYIQQEHAANPYLASHNHNHSHSHHNHGNHNLNHNHQHMQHNYDYELEMSNAQENLEAARFNSMLLKQDSNSSSFNNHKSSNQSQPVPLHHPKSASQNKYCDKFLRNFNLAEQRRLQAKRNSIEESNFIPYTTAAPAAHNECQYLPPQNLGSHNATNMSAVNQPILHKIPIIFGDLNPKRDSVPINFLYNSPLRTYHRCSMNQLKINTLRTQLKMNVGGSDGEEAAEDTSSNAGSNSSGGSNSFRNGHITTNHGSGHLQSNSKTNMMVSQDKSYLSLPEVKNMNNYLSSRRRSSTNSLASNGGGLSVPRRKSWDYNQFLPLRSKRNSIEDLRLAANANVINEYPSVNLTNQARRDSLKKYGSTHFGQPNSVNFNRVI